MAEDNWAPSPAGTQQRSVFVVPTEAMVYIYSIGF